MALRIYETILPINGIIVKATHTRVRNNNSSSFQHTFDLVLTWVNRDLELCMGLDHSSFSLLEPWEEETLNKCIAKGELSVGAPWVVDPEDITLICGSFD